MFAIVRTGGKQYRVAAGDKIVVEKLDGEAGSTVTLGDVLLAGEGGDLKSTDGLTVSAEIMVGTRSVLGYFLYPITRGLQESIREP